MNKWFKLIRYDWPLHFVLVLTNWLPDNVFFIRLRGSLARPFFKSCGAKLGIGRNVCFYNPSNISFGDNVYIAYGCWFGGNISIKSDVLFGPYCVLAPTNHQFKNGTYNQSENTKGKIEIMDGCWMGAHAMVVGASVLQKGTLIAANSTFMGKSETFGVYGGTPAKLLKIQE